MMNLYENRIHTSDIDRFKFTYLLLLNSPWFGRDRIVVSTLRCGRNNPGSNPGHGMSMSYHGNKDIIFS